MKTKLLLLGLTLAALHARATSTLTASWTGSQTIPDNNASGVAFTFNLAPGAGLSIDSLKVDLNLAGGWNGDLYAYLSHGSGLAVLLNRVGRTAGNSGGSASAGFNIELADSYATDIHGATGNPITGNYAPDGRAVSPFGALDTDPRTALLGSFTGLDPSGNWTLFLADVSPLAVASVQSWSVSLNVSPVPEPTTPALLALAALVAFLKKGK